MNIPQFSQKFQFAPLISPEKTLEYMKKVGRVPEGPPPKKIIFCYQGSFLERVVASHEGHWSSGIFRHLYWLKSFPGIAIGDFGIGAPQVVTKMELLIAWGVREFLSIGTAGAIATDLKIGDLVGCNRALRDEGTSHHYLPKGRYCYPTDGGAFASKFSRVGTTWTLDAFFRHTKEEIQKYQQEGVLTVEMETSALFAVGQVRKVSVGAGFVVSDLLSGDSWEPELYQTKVEDGLDRLLSLSV